MKHVEYLAALLILIIPMTVSAADLAWDYAADYADIDGWTVYYSDGVDTYNKTFGKADVTEDGTTVRYVDIESKLNLAFDVPYTFTLHAYNDNGESGPSNDVTWERTGYDPPVDVLPPDVPGGSGDPTGLGVE